MKKVEHDRLAKHFMQGIQNMIALKIDNAELDRKVKELEDTLEGKEEINNQLIAKQSAKLIKRKIKCTKLKQKVRKLKKQQN